MNGRDNGVAVTTSAAAGTLKGYELTADTPEVPVSTVVAEQHDNKRHCPSVLAATNPAATHNRSQAGSKAPSPVIKQHKYEGFGKPDDFAKEASGSHKEAKRQEIARKAKRSRVAFEGDSSQVGPNYIVPCIHLPDCTMYCKAAVLLTPL